MSDLIELPEASPAARAAAASLIGHMRNEYGEKFAKQWAHLKADDQIDHWARRLAGYTAGEVRRGLVALSTRAYPPTLPEFLALCRPPIDAEAAFYEAVAGMQARQRGELGEWSHPAIYWAAVRVSAHDLLANGYAVMRGRWENALRDWLSKGKWSDIPMPVMALPAPGAAVTSDEEARRRLKQLGAAGILQSAGAERDTGWATRILDREAPGKDRPPAAVLHMARRALGLPEVPQQ